MFLVVRRKTRRCHFSVWNGMTWMRNCLFLRLVYFEVSEAPFPCAAMVYFCIKYLQWYLLFYFLTWGERGRKRSHHVLNPYITRFGETRRKLQGEKKRSPKITCLSKLVFRDVPSQYQVSGCPKTWDWLPNCHVPQKWPTLLPNVHPTGRVPKYLHLLLLVSRFEPFGSSQMLQFHAFQYTPPPRG